MGVLHEKKPCKNAAKKQTKVCGPTAMKSRESMEHLEISLSKWMAGSAPTATNFPGVHLVHPKDISN